MGTSLLSQSGFSYCSTPEPLCDNFSAMSISYNFDNNTNSVCLNGTTRMFFKFQAAYDNILTSGIGSYNFAYAVNASGQSNIISSIKIHGPFTASENACDKINSFQSPVAFQMNSTGSAANNMYFTMQANKYYYLEVVAHACNGTVVFTSGDFTRLITCEPPPPCEECIPDFQPPAGQYVLSAWVKEKGVAAGTTTYASAKIRVTDNNGVIGTFQASGEIIDGWQKIDAIFTIDDPSVLEVELISGSNETLFDDIRFYPKDGSAITYVYDPITFRLMAELDERNFATLYEYDEEGKLIRIKKETEKGVMTIQENRENNSLNNGQ